jgi:hypothetical protein
MDRETWDRWAPGFGIVFAVLFLVGFLLVGDSPEIGAPADEIGSFYADDRGKLLTVTVLFGLSVIAFLWFLASLATMLRQAGEPRLAATSFGAGVLTTSLFGGVILMNAGLAFKIAEDGDAGVVTALYDLSWALSVLISYPAAALVGAAGIASLRSRLLPEWFGWASVVAALAVLVSGTTWARSGFWAPDGAYNAYITPIVLVAWIVAVSVLLLTRPVVAAEPPRQT